MNLDLDQLIQAVAQGTAFRTRVELQPAGGANDKVFPPTYAGAAYAMEERRFRPAQADGKQVSENVPAVLLDSVQSQANRIEESLQEAWENGDLRDFLPVTVVDFESCSVGDDGDLLEPVSNVTSLTAPHRIADAILRDSLLNGQAFHATEVRQRIASSSLRNARPLYEVCPTALVFGLWDSTGPKGGLGAKFQRALVSEIVGINATVGVKTSSRIDPLGIRASVKVKKGDGGTYAIAEKEEKGSVRPSEINHGNVTPSIGETGGVTLDYAEQTTVLSLPALRRLRFPKTGERPSPEVDRAGQAVLTALALYAVALTTERGLDLRSRCLLFPSGPVRWEFLGGAGSAADVVELRPEPALELLKAAVKHAESLGLTWRKEPLVLKPSPQLLALVKASQRRAITEGDPTEGE